MVEPTSGADPQKLRKAFDEAVRRYRDKEWNPGLPVYPRVTIDSEHFSIRVVCGLVTGFTDELPDDVLNDLRKQCMHAIHWELQQTLGRDPTYGTGAQCLLELMDERETAFRQQQRTSQ